MKFLLINCPQNFNVMDNDGPPLGLGVIKGCLVEQGHKVEIFDFNIMKYGRNRMPTDVDVYGLSFASSSYYIAKKIIKDLQLLERPIVLGGPHVTALPELTLKETGCQVVVRGEGEFAALALAESEFKHQKLKEIAGISFSHSGKIYHNKASSGIYNLDTLPFASKHLSMDKYRNLSICSSRGCPYRCIFCRNSKRMVPVRFRSAENVVQELSYMTEKYGNKAPYWFVDDHLTLHKERLLLICKLIIESGLDIRWFCNSRVDAVDFEDLNVMAKAGCYKIAYGIETGDLESLRKIDKQITFAQVKKAVTLTKSAGIQAKGAFIIGFPWETKNHIINTLKLARKLKLDEYSFYLATPFPETILWDMAVDDGLIDENDVDWTKFTLKNAVFKNLSSEYLNRVLENAEFYARVGSSVREMFSLRNWFNTISKGKKKHMLEHFPNLRYLLHHFINKQDIIRVLLNLE